MLRRVLLPDCAPRELTGTSGQLATLFRVPAAAVHALLCRQVDGDCQTDGGRRNEAVGSRICVVC